jgi:nucleoside-diphosphate-sugar epimerase
MKVFLTGHKGYVGRKLSQILLNANHKVVGCDIEYFPSNMSSEQQDKNIEQLVSLKKDIRDLTHNDLSGCDAVIHLAALSNDPLGDISATITNEINYEATIQLGKLAKAANVPRFVFSSSCSSYGANEEIVNENSPLVPLTAYAKSKVKSESDLLKLKDDNFIPVILRSATAYGISPNLRLDLVVNNLTCSALTTGKVEMLSDGTAWRPLLHVEDMANAFLLTLESPEDKVSGEIFNVGSNNDNYIVKDIAQKVEEIVPDSIISFSKEANKDHRSYQVNFDKIRDILGFKTKWNLTDGIKDIYKVIKNEKMTKDSFEDKKFYRVKYINWLIEQNQIDNSLRFSP